MTSLIKVGVKLISTFPVIQNNKLSTLMHKTANQKKKTYNLLCHNNVWNNKEYLQNVIGPNHKVHIKAQLIEFPLGYFILYYG
jgi:hypothetical protein